MSAEGESLEDKSGSLALAKSERVGDNQTSDVLGGSALDGSALGGGALGGGALDGGLRRLVRGYIGFRAFFGLLFWVPIFFVYQERMGLSHAEILFIQSLYQVAFSVLEIPTGWYADRKGHLWALKVGASVLIVANFLPIFAPVFFGFLAHFMLVALARSFVSGAASAYLYDSLQIRGEAGRYGRIEGSARSFELAVKVIGWAGVGAMMEWRLSAPYWMTAAASSVALGLAFFMSRGADPKAVRVSATKEADVAADRDTTLAAISPNGPFRRALLELIRQPVLQILMLQSAGLFVLSRIVQVILFQPLLGAKGIPVAAFGAVMAAMTLFEAAGSLPNFDRARGRLGEGRLGRMGLVTGMTLAVAALTGALALLGALGSVAALCLIAFGTGLIFPVQRQLMNDAIVDSGCRATVLSIESIIDRVASAAVTMGIAGLLASGRLAEILVYAALFAALASAAPLLLGISRRPLLNKPMLLKKQ